MKKHDFEYYVDNGGTTVALSGKKFVVFAADTRLSEGYNILSRKTSKILPLTDKCCIVSAGMQSDIATLHKVLKTRLTIYEHNHNKKMSVESVAQMLSNILYYRRNAPYYTFNLVGGLNEKGEGVVYSFDAIGSYNITGAGVSGSGQELVQPLLDSQYLFKNQKYVPEKPIEMEEACSLVKDAFTSAGERDIYTGDAVEIVIVTPEGLKYDSVALKKD